MTEKDHNEMQCGQFEALLSDVLDDAASLSPEARRAFQAHAESCAACGPIFAEAQQGMLWLRGLEEVEPPANLVHNILAVTSIAESTQATPMAKAARPEWLSRLWRPVRGVLAGAIQPRFATSFSMAFFSLSLTLTLAGVKLKDIAHFDWRPSSLGKAVVMQYTQVESKVVRYYNNMRLVYEIESRVDELRKNSGGDQKKDAAPDKPKEEKKRDKNDTSGSPEQRQDNYSQELDHAVIAYMRLRHGGA